MTGTYVKKLKAALSLSITKSTNKLNRTSSIAVSQSGKTYAAGSVDSDTHLLNFPSEQMVLLLSSQQQDFKIKEVVTLVENETEWKDTISPLVIKILIDYSVRTGIPLAYRVINPKGISLFSTKNVMQSMSFYKPKVHILSKTKTGKPYLNNTRVRNIKNIPAVLKEYTLRGIENGFSREDVGTKYAAAVITKKGMVYWGGQYSSFEKRLNIHAEMAVFLGAAMHKDTDVIALGVLSEKHTDTPCEICGCCRQFFSEMSSRFSQKIDFYCFAKDAGTYKKYSLDDLLPHRWESKKW